MVQPDQNFQIEPKDQDYFDEFIERRLDGDTVKRLLGGRKTLTTVTTEDNTKINREEK